MNNQACMDLAGWTLAFDLDGTLVDTAPDLIGALNEVLLENGLPPLALKASRFLVGRGARTLIERGFAAAGRPLPDPAPLVDRFLSIYRERIALESRPFPGVVEALDRLSSAGAKLCVCTNKPTDLSLRLLEALGLLRRFSAVVGADRAPKPKPDASHLLAALAEAGGEAARALMVGDSETDVGAARAAGVPVIVVPFGYTEVRPEKLGADRMAEGFGDLFEIVCDLASALKRKQGLDIGQAAGPEALDA